jgi:hypothetical protein
MPIKLYFPNRTQAPPGGWRYLVKETGVEIHGVNEGNCIEAVKKHYRANNLVPPYDLSYEMEQYICSKVPDYCGSNEPRLSFWEGFKRTTKQFVTGTKTIATWLKEGRSATQEQAESRAKICASCKLNQEPLDCVTCKAQDIVGFVNGVLGGRSTSLDSQLHGCEPCGCSNKVKVHVPLDIIRDKMPEPIRRKLPANCWVLTEKPNG